MRYYLSPPRKAGTACHRCLKCQHGAHVNSNYSIWHQKLHYQLDGINSSAHKSALNEIKANYFFSVFLPLISHLLEYNDSIFQSHGV